VNARDFEPMEAWPVAQQSALAEAVRAAVINPSQSYGYAVLANGEIDVQTFPDAESMRRALAAIFTAGSNWGYPLGWESVLFFEPEKPLWLHLVVELDDDELDEAGEDES
jgi:hypothetical protein